MVKYLQRTLSIVCIILITQTGLYAQQVIQNQKFTYIPTINDKAILLKEIPLDDVSETADNYTKLKNWVKDNYTPDLINSSIIYYKNDLAVLVKSKVELLLPLLNSDNISEKSVMTYHLYSFIENGKCIIQISDIEYKVENMIPAVKKKIKAEDFVTKDALLINDVYRRERTETQKGTLFFFNKLIDSLEVTMNSSNPKF